MENMSAEEQPLQPSGGRDTEAGSEASASIWSSPGQWLAQTARKLKREVVVLYCASADPRLPLLARIWAGLVIGYALSPFDLIPDWIPVLGILDGSLLACFTKFRYLVKMLKMVTASQSPFCSLCCFFPPTSELNL